MSGQEYDHIFLFTGHMVDDTYRRNQRFPLSSEKAAQVQILRAIDSLVDGYTGTRLAISSRQVRGPVVGQTRRLVFQLAEVVVPSALFQRLLERIGRLCPAPG